MTASLVLHVLAPLLLALAIVWAAGFMAGGGPSRLLAVLLATALAHGLAGLDAMAARLLAPAVSGREWLVELVVAAAIVGGWARRPRPSWRSPALPPGTGWRRAWGLALLAALVAAAWASLAGLLDVMRAYPHGPMSDAYALWNLKARFLYRAGADWTRLFDGQLRHTGYPLVHPALVARLWGAMGDDAVAVPQALVVSYLLLTVATVVSALNALRGWITGAVAGLALLCMHFFVENGANQCADLPLGVYALAALTCLALGREIPTLERTSLALAGAFASLAAWTKTEGALLVVALVAAVAVTGGGGARPRLERGLRAAAGAAPALALLIYMNAAYLQVPSPYTHQPGQVVIGRVLTGERHLQILGAGADFARRQWLPLGLLVLVALAGRLAGAGRGQGAAQRAIVITLGLVAVGFYAVYLTTPFPLPWQLSFSLDRLCMQYWPALALLAFARGLEPAP